MKISLLMENPGVIGCATCPAGNQTPHITYCGEEKIQPLLRAALLLMLHTDEDDLRVIAGPNTIIVQTLGREFDKSGGHVVVVCLPTGHAFSKSVRRAIRRLHNRRNTGAGEVEEQRFGDGEPPLPDVERVRCGVGGLGDEARNIVSAQFSLVDAQAELATVAAKTKQQWAAEYEARHAEAEKQRLELNAYRQELLVRFQTFKTEFDANKARLMTVGDGALAKMMDEELERGIKDASRFDGPSERPNLDDWIAERIASYTRRVTWASESLQGAMQRRAYREAWFKSLVAIMPPPEPAE